MIKRRELPCHFKWFVERGVDRTGQSDPVGDTGIVADVLKLLGAV